MWCNRAGRFLMDRLKTNYMFTVIKKHDAQRDVITAALSQPEHTQYFHFLRY